ncbi:MAG: STAS domain-containing protein [Solirubrobacteraceae bacterium]
MTRAAPERDPAPDELASLTMNERDGIVWASLAGEVDISNVGMIEADLHTLRNEALGLVLDLRGTGFIDSSAVSLLHGLRERLRRRGQTLRIVAVAGSAPRRVLELTGFERGGPLDEAVDGAEAAIRAAAARPDSG